jgi:hypothetical protein
MILLGIAQYVKLILGQQKYIQKKIIIQPDLAFGENQI